MRSYPKLSVILPVFNEGKNITPQLLSIEKTILTNHEILVVYDLDNDDTIPPVLKLQNKFKNIKLIKNIYGRGVINAVKTGFKKSRGEFLVVMPADLADNPDTVNKMYKKISQGYDIVCATRYGQGGAKIGGPFIKTILSKIAGLSSPALLGIPTTDIANGFKMYRKKVIEKINIESDGGWEFAMEILIKANKMGFKISEIPTVWQDRTQGKSKFKLLKWLPKYIRWYLVGLGYRLNINWLIL